VNFFEGKCDARELAMVQAWLNENPARLKEYIGMEEWENFQPAHALSPEISGKLWNNIKKNNATPVMPYPWFKWMAVAASVLLAIGLSWQFLAKKQKPGIVSTATVATTKKVVNNAPQKKALMLSDGSTVELLSNSTLSYPANFNSLKRAVILTGEATFDIAKDAAKPFSVHSNSVLITVLGTRFTVNAYEANTATKVILQEGRVMITISDSSSPEDKREYFLDPGDIFLFRKAKPARIFHLEKDKEGSYTFDNYPLDVVFDQLQIIYNTKILYNKAELGNRSFIGKIDKNDPLSHILQSIALLNKFGFHKQGDSYLISN
jgi:ferric-dicitrate binding protein FerR (iron transport regulator)